jgi:hypothetical protein
MKRNNNRTSKHSRIRKEQGKMPIPTRRELAQKIEELEGENEELRSRLEEIGDLASTEEEDDQGE